MSNEDSGFICLFRKILEWGWYSEINTKVLFIHMLLKANWKDGNFKGTIVPRGSFVSSASKLAEETGLTIDEVRTAISHLVSTKEITKQSTNKYTVFTVVNYALYGEIITFSLPRVKRGNERNDFKKMYIRPITGRNEKSHYVYPQDFSRRV